MVAALNAAYGEGVLPWEILEISLCERFGCLPWDLDGQDIGRLLYGIKLNNIYQIAHKHAQGDKLNDSENETFGKVLQYELDLKRG